MLTGQFCTYSLAMAALLFLANIVRKSIYLDATKSRYLMYAILSNVLVFLGFMGKNLALLWSSRFLGCVSTSVTFIFGIGILYFLILSVSKDHVLKNWFFHVLGLLTAANTLLSVLSVWTKTYFNVLNTGAFLRGPLYFIPFILGGFYLILWTVCLMQVYKKIDLKDKFHIFGMLALELFAVALESYVTYFNIEYVGSTLTLMLYYAFLIEIEGKYDQMTKAYTRRYYEKKTERMKRRKKHAYALMAFDVNGLKYTNDNLGHETGDLLIKTVASEIKKVVGRSGKVFRVGGDEFVAILNSASGDVIRRIEERLPEAFGMRERVLKIPVSASFGAAVPEENENFDDVLMRADKKMYEMKNAYYASWEHERRKSGQ